MMSAAADELTPDITYRILSRLPIKSLARFQLVCKSWHKYINDPYLRTIHVKEEPTPIMFERSRSMQRNKQCKVSLLLRVTEEDTTTMNVKTEPVLEFCRKGQPIGIVVIGSCNGLTLVCSEFDRSHATLLSVINPLTKQRYNLPPISSTIWSKHHDWTGVHEAAGIGFDDSTNTFTTVCNDHVTTLVHRSGMSSWRVLAQNPPYPIKFKSIFARGRLHWLSSGLLNYTGRRIVWFDVKTEEFGFTDVPEPKGGWNNVDYDELVDLNGEIAIADTYKDFRIELWMLKPEGFVLGCCFDPNLLPDVPVVVSGCWNNEGDILLTSIGFSQRLFVYTRKTGDLREVVRDRYDEHETRILVYQSSFFLMPGINTALKGLKLEGTCS